MFSGTIAPALLTLTHVVVPLTLLEVHPVGYAIGVPVVVPITLYVTLKSRPVVGVVVEAICAITTSSVPGLE